MCVCEAGVRIKGGEVKGGIPPEIPINPNHIQKLCGEFFLSAFIFGYFKTKKFLFPLSSRLLKKITFFAASLTKVQKRD